MPRDIIVRIVCFVGGLLFIPLVVSILGFAGALPYAATPDPPGWEESLGQSFLEASIASEAASLTNPITADNEADLLAGMRVYRMNCAGCHGDADAPSKWGTRGFYPRVPQFADAHPDLTAAEMFVILRDGIRYSGMGAWRDLMSEHERWQVANFLSSLDHLPAAVEVRWKNPRAR